MNRFYWVTALSSIIEMSILIRPNFSSSARMIAWKVPIFLFFYALKVSMANESDVFFELFSYQVFTTFSSNGPWNIPMMQAI